MKINENKYSRAYFAIVEKAKSRALVGYTELHHIIPRSLGGTNRSENLVRLTAKEHFVCHLLLIKCLSGQDKAKMVFAASRMANTGNVFQTGRYVPSSRIYEIIRAGAGAQQREAMLANNPMNNQITRKAHQAAIDLRGPTSGMTGKSHNIETKKKMSNASAAQIITEATRAKLSIHMKQIVSHESYTNPMDRPGAREKYNAAMVGRTERNKKTCSHCEKTMAANTYARFHGNNCKLKELVK